MTALARGVEPMSRFQKGRDAPDNDGPRLVRVAKTGKFQADYRLIERPLVPMSFPLGRKWFLLAVHDRAERRVCEDLNLLGYETFCPEQVKRRIKAGRKVDEVTPVFAGYVFVSFDRERDEWGEIASVDGSIDILSNDGIPIQVPDPVMRQLMDWDSTGVFSDANKLRVGEEVEVTAGPFASTFHKVKSATARKRGKVLLDGLLGTLEIDMAFLRRA